MKASPRDIVPTPQSVTDANLLALLYGSDRRLLSARRLADIFTISRRQSPHLLTRLIALPNVSHEPGPNGQTFIWTVPPNELHVPPEKSDHHVTVPPSTPPLKGGGVCPRVSGTVSDTDNGPSLTNEQRAALLAKIMNKPTPPPWQNQTTLQQMLTLNIQPQEQPTQ